ncbi:hypothetical protein H6G54_12965 [Anabaena cylindrica FACHB-243]|uniref:hypothetical protein n=1 Tax=Anabaena TaxID=1163 RepID=UPI0005AA0C91|nr:MULTISPECIES: hypothetical protein [Anabaena]MBD2418591.1 hypothetical protein [Anabaena cylindrica FACHB-243]MBY5283603.1 hypothetical protein [Anabaena sp. CCAP 1446/1C]MBY5311297.1 hypothetical protein [Anabaena sp. CCAP 1446/1C]MCM2409337.1 hypothetical protein [Anabaena sp. CCAP 1446/1C]BAY06266.1 amidohydrolase 2 [Anabaena cylindrica PCC 7122]
MPKSDSNSWSCAVCDRCIPKIAHTFNRKAHPFGDRVKAFLGSDFGHWDLPDITAVVTNSYTFVVKLTQVSH